MTAGVFGRTNLEFPPVWLGLSVPPDSSDLPSLVEAALDAHVPIDISIQPALWGGHMRGTDAFVTCIGTSAHERATDSAHAANLTQAHLIETLSCLGREHLDIYYVRVRRAVEEYQLAGVLEALEMFRQEGHIRFLGLCCDGSGLATLGAWQFNDAFEVLQTPVAEFQMLASMAAERRVGLVTREQAMPGHPVLRTVRTADEVRQAVSGP